MASLRSFLSIFLILAFAFTSGAAASPSIIRKFSSKNLMGRSNEAGMCNSWKYSFEVNNLRNLEVPSECVPTVVKYYNDNSYKIDLFYAFDAAYEFASMVKLNSDGKDAWVFGIDDTLLSNLPYYEVHGYGSETFNETQYYEWAEKADAPAIPWSMRLYEQLKDLGFELVLLTGRDEFARTYTEQNLRNSGISNWDHLIMRQTEDQGKNALMYKSEKRTMLEKMGYKLHGNIGDQWSDLLGSSSATRSFKLPNLLYYVP